MKKYFLISIMILLLGVVFVESAENVVFSLTLHYNQGQISKENIFLIDSQEPIQPQKYGDYLLKIYSFDGKLLYESGFNIGLDKRFEPNSAWFDEKGNQIVFPEVIDTTQITKEDEKYFSLFFPYFYDAQKIKISKGAELKLEIDISEFALCNNNRICDGKETKEICPKECKPSSFQKKTSSALTSSFLKGMLGAILTATIILAIYFIIRYGIKKCKSSKTKKFCNKCRNKIKINTKFCNKCGAKVKK